MVRTGLTCLVTGGAGFIGCAVSGELVERFARVIALDNLHPQIHPTPVRPVRLDGRVELFRGDVTVAADWDHPGRRATGRGHSSRGRNRNGSIAYRRLTPRHSERCWNDTNARRLCPA